MIIRTIALMLIASLMAGCSPLAPRPDKSSFFLLTPLSTDGAAAAASLSADPHLSIGVGPIDFPGYLKRQQIVTRSEANQLTLSEERLWAEPLDKNFTRVLSDNLSELLGTQRVETYPWPRKTEVDYQVIIDVTRFEASADGQTTLHARWTIRDPRSGKDLYSSQTTANAAGSGGTSSAAALSSDLGILSREIAAQITALEPHRGRQARAAEPGASFTHRSSSHVSVN